MSDRHSQLVARLREAVLGSRGETDTSVRVAVEARAASLGGRSDAGGAGVPAELAGLVDKIARHAYRVTDDDVAALRQAGYSEDALFEITASAALGAGLGRLERGLAAVRGEV